MPLLSSVNSLISQWVRCRSVTSKTEKVRGPSGLPVVPLYVIICLSAVAIELLQHHGPGAGYYVANAVVEVRLCCWYH